MRKMNVINGRNCEIVMYMCNKKNLYFLSDFDRNFWNSTLLKGIGFNWISRSNVNKPKSLGEEFRNSLFTRFLSVSGTKFQIQIEIVLTWLKN